MRRGVRWADRTRASYGTSNSSRASAAGSITGQSESLPMTMPTTGSLLGPLTPLSSVLGVEREGGVHHAVGQVPGRGDRSRAHLGDVVAEGRHMAELATAALTLAVPVQLHVRPVGHEVVDALVEGRAGPVRLGSRAAEDVGDHRARGCDACV